MPLKVSVSLSRASPGPGSPSVTVTLEADLEGSALTDPARLRDQMRAPLAAIREVLAHEMPDVAVASGGSSPRAPTRNGNGRGGNRPATAAQVRAITALARRQGLDLGAWLREHAGVNRVEDLTVQQASGVIDDLKAPAR